MKYHYQYVSKTTVRIELIPEDQKETTLISSLSQANEDDQHLLHLFENGLENYANGYSLVKVNFMKFPKVALCKFVKSEISVATNP